MHLDLDIKTEIIHRTFRKVRGNDDPMGGLCVIFSGNWRQCLPIIHRGSQGQIVDACLKSSLLWPSVKVFHPTENMRVKMAGTTELKSHSEWLLRVGNGECGHGEVTIPEQMRLEEDTLACLVDEVFPNIAQRFRDSDWVSSRAIISPTNAEVDEVNEEVLRRLPGQETIFSSIDSTEDGSPEFAPEFLNTLSTSGMPPHLLKLKLGALVILMRNMDSKLGHCNGVKYVVVNILPHLLELRSTSGFNKGATLLLPRITTISDTPALPFVLRRKQFPVKLAYGLSANKVKKKINSLEMKSYFSGPGTDYGWRRHLPWQRLVWPRTSLCGTQQGWRPLPYEGESTIEICECRKTWLT